MLRQLSSWMWYIKNKNNNTFLVNVSKKNSKTVVATVCHWMISWEKIIMLKLMFSTHGAVPTATANQYNINFDFL